MTSQGLPILGKPVRSYPPQTRGSIVSAHVGWAET